jgi:PHD/YefM family antitoxin component YafN of YafNO toxin-antitoxin module
MLDTREIYSLSEFVRNPKAHVARLKETRTPEVLTVNGRAEVVLLDTETYENLVKRLQTADEIAAVRAIIRKAKCAGPHEEIPEAEMERREAVMKELVEETERLGLYR